MASADATAQGSRWGGRFGEYAASAARRARLYDNGALAESWGTMEFGFYQWSVPAFLDTELGCQLTDFSES